MKADKIKNLIRFLSEMKYLRIFIPVPKRNIRRNDVSDLFFC